jgi:hypothetical protein
MEAIRKCGSLVAVAHPNYLSASKLVGAEEGGWLIDEDFHAAIFLLVANANLAAKALNKELEAVANAEDEDAIGLSPREEAFGEGGGVWRVDRMGAAGENDDGGVEVGDGFEGRGAGDAEGEDGEAANTASDEVSVLGAIVEDENEV